MGAWRLTLGRGCVHGASLLIGWTFGRVALDWVELWEWMHGVSLLIGGIWGGHGLIHVWRLGWKRGCLSLGGNLGVDAWRPLS